MTAAGRLRPVSFPRGIAASLRRMLLRLLAAWTLASSIALWTDVSFAAETRPGSAHPRVVCLGDSLTEGFSLPPGQAWPDVVQGMLRKEGWPDLEIINAGVSGSTSASAVSRLKWQLRLEPDVLVLALGANDGLRGIAPEETRKNLAAAIDLARENGIVVLLAGMKMPPNYGGEYTRQFSATFSSLAEEKNVALIPFLLEGVAGDPALNLPDGVHPNAKGYEVVAHTVAQHLRPVLGKLESAGGTGVPEPHPSLCRLQ